MPSRNDRETLMLGGVPVSLPVVKSAEGTVTVEVTDEQAEYLQKNNMSFEIPASVVTVLQSPLDMPDDKYKKFIEKLDEEEFEKELQDKLEYLVNDTRKPDTYCGTPRIYALQKAVNCLKVMCERGYTHEAWDDFIKKIVKAADKDD
jgi:hypothetical protein